MQISKLLSKKHILKSILFVIIVGGVFFLDSHTGNTVWAQTIAEQTSSDQAVQAIDTILKIIYMIFYPLIFIAGLAMDNSLIYGEVFHLDLPLWKFWNVIKNLANFTLGFMVLFTILKNIFNLGKKVEDVKKIITKTLIAGVLIQASWFLTAALIDISTIATYGIGALPMSVIGGTKAGDQKILAVDSVFDVNKAYDKNQKGEALMTSFRVKYNNENISLSPCKIEKSGGGDSYVVGRQYSDEKYKNYGTFGNFNGMGIGDVRKSACVLNGNQIVVYNEFPELTGLVGSDYEHKLEWTLGLSSDSKWRKDRRPREFCGYVININGSSGPGECGEGIPEVASFLKVSLAIDQNSDAAIENKKVLDEFKAWTEEAIKNKPTVGNEVGIKAGQERFEDKKVEAMTISKLIDKSKGMVGPMMTMFSSIMNFSQLSDNSTKNGIGAITMETIIKLLFALAIFFPLLALAIVLVARIGLLRLIVAASPFLVLIEVFGDQIKGVKDMIKDFDITNVIKIVFAPVITVFALSMSIIFLQTLISGLNTNNDTDCTKQKETYESMQITPIYQSGSCKTDEYKLLGGLISLKATGSENWTGTADLFSWTIVNVFAIALIWFIVFASFKASGTILGKVGEGVQKFGASVMKTAPIMPVPGVGKGVGMGTFKDKIFGTGGNNAIWNRKISNIEQEQERELDKKFFPEENSDKKGTKNDNEQKNKKIIEYVNKESTPTMEGLKRQDQNITTDYMTRADTIQAIEAKLGEQNIKTEENITKLALLLEGNINEKVRTITPTKIEELKGIFNDILSSGDAISKKYLEDFIGKAENNFENILDGTQKKTYKIVKDSNNNFTLEGQVMPTPSPAPITPPTPAPTP